MEKLRELMKEHQDKADKKVMGEVLEPLQREPGLFVVTVQGDEKTSSWVQRTARRLLSFTPAASMQMSS
ncbi:MAG: hypothetical protein ACLT76_01235 [Clostridium fessum]